MIGVDPGKVFLKKEKDHKKISKGYCRKFQTVL